MIREQPNWYMKIQDEEGNLLIDENEGQVIMSVTVKDLEGKERVGVWIGTYEEDIFLLVDSLDTQMMINVLGAMIEELDDDKDHF